MRIVFVSLLLLCACSPAYVPNLRNAPMFTKKGEFQGSVQIMNGLDVQAAFSITKNVAVMANYAWGRRGDYSERTNFHRHQLSEGGLGYFRSNDNVGFQIFGGYGEGQAEGLYEFLFFGPTPILATFKRYFVQPGVGFYRNHFTMGVVGRVSLLDFTLYRDQLTALTYDKEDMYFFEPAFIAQYYFAKNRMFLTMQGGLAVSLRENANDGFQYRFITLGTGIGMRLGGTKELITHK
jgi:hypothetical protein